MSSLVSQLSSRERVRLTLERQETDRIPRKESFWSDTIRNWRHQGMPDDLDLDDHFGYDILGCGWINHEARVGYQRTVEETDDWRTFENGNGAILRFWKHKSGTPEHLNFTVKTRDDWYRYRQDLLETPIAQRINLQQCIMQMQRARREQKWLVWTGVECFEIMKEVVGHEHLCIAMAEDPDWAAEMYMTQALLAVRVLDYMEANGASFDGAWIYGDIAYNHGPFISPSMYRRLVMPAHRVQVDWFRQRDLPVIYHTDGDFRPLIPAMLELGISCFQPLEAKANLNLHELVPKYGDRVSFMGNIDIMVLITNDREQIEAEIADKLAVGMSRHGYIYHSDHSVPPQVTWPTYQFVMDRVRHYGRYS